MSYTAKTAEPEYSTNGEGPPLCALPYMVIRRLFLSYPFRSSVVRRSSLCHLELLRQHFQRCAGGSANRTRNPHLALIALGGSGDGAKAAVFRGTGVVIMSYECTGRRKNEKAELSGKISNDNRSRVMNKSLPIQSFELAMAAPQVVAHRLIRLSSIGQPSSDAYNKSYRVWTETVVGFGESWNAMFFDVMRYQQKMLTTVAANWLAPWMVRPAIVKSAPAVGKSAPSIAKSKSVVANSKPAVAKSAPAVAKSIPAVGKSAPSIAKSAPAVPRSKPAVGKSAPAVAKSAPVQTPSAGEGVTRKGLAPIQRKTVANKKQSSTAKKKRSAA
jgi:hypothetical protein